MTTVDDQPGSQPSALRVVLVETHHPGNIGSAARAMHAMGLDDLWLVRPKQFPDPQAKMMATEASGLLDHVKVVDTLEEAIADCVLAIAATRRSRQRFWPCTDITSAMQRARIEGQVQPVAVVFGPEPSGLATSQVQCCDIQAAIPTVERGGSLNLAQAVQIVAWEWRRLQLSANVASPPEEWASVAERDRLAQILLERLRAQLGGDEDAASKALLRLRAMIQRGGMTRSEWRLINGLLHQSTS